MVFGCFWMQTNGIDARHRKQTGGGDAYLGRGRFPALQREECNVACSPRCATTGLTAPVTERTTFSAPAVTGTSRPVGLPLCASQAARYGAREAAAEVSEVSVMRNMYKTKAK